MVGFRNNMGRYLGAEQTMDGGRNGTSFFVGSFLDFLEILDVADLSNHAFSLEENNTVTR